MNIGPVQIFEYLGGPALSNDQASVLLGDLRQFAQGNAEEIPPHRRDAINGAIDALLEQASGCLKARDPADFEIPDLWHIAHRLIRDGRRLDGEMVLATWHLAHKLLQIVKERSCQKPSESTPRAPSTSRSRSRPSSIRA